MRHSLTVNTGPKSPGSASGAAILVSVLLLLLAACGHKGPLYLEKGQSGKQPSDIETMIPEQEEARKESSSGN